MLWDLSNETRTPVCLTHARKSANRDACAVCRVQYSFQAESELEALRSELQQQQQELSKRAEALAVAAKEGAAQVRPRARGVSRPASRNWIESVQPVGALPHAA